MKENDPRSVFKTLFREQLIGPGSDYVFEQEESEVISDYPLNRYSSGIIFPKMNLSELYDTMSDDADDDVFFQDEIDLEIDLDSEEEDTSSPASRIDAEDSKIEDFARPELYPNSMGLSFCVANDAGDIDIEISFGTYTQQDPTQNLNPSIRLKMNEADYELIKPLNAGNTNYLGKILQYDKVTQTVSLNRLLKGSRTYPQSDDFEDFKLIRRRVYEQMNDVKGEAKERYAKLSKLLDDVSLLYKNSWQRKAHVFNYKIKPEDFDGGSSIITIFEKVDKNGMCFKLHLMQIELNENYRILKALLENANSIDVAKESFRRKPVLNTLSMFQCKLKVISVSLREMPKPPISSYASVDDKIADCQYRESKIYALSHNCACAWNLDDQIINVQTEYLPAVIPPVSKNIGIGDFKAALNIFENSKYSTKSDDSILDDLALFISHYENWTHEQIEISSSLDTRYSVAVKAIIDGQQSALKRLKEGVEVLKNKEYLELYKITNSIMCINMLDYDSRSEVHRSPKAKDMHYHAFQLAFLLINLKYIIHSDAEERTNSVDLLWFPTGGGKTEAYFLLAIYSLLFRRINMGDRGLGTSVIMRYTLRLLTAQQFERASRMILSMNYVCREYMPELIEKEPFSIGLWVGAASSPNNLSDAKNEIDTILESNGSKDKLRNVKLPVLECPWCNSSLVGDGIVGFSSLKQRFEVKCLNPDCHFKQGLPIDFIDESMYHNPPTILFATVDKFASLASVEKASVFFGSDQTIPPDLIIQDELHLISGPLGSASALFENVVDRLCQKDGVAPRIVASTATIKNAGVQIKALFGNRTVSHFPPPGINYADNFFAKVDIGNYNREYLGVYPTGRSFSQLQLKTTALSLYGRLKLWEKNYDNLDNYWTIVTYFNSLRELGRMYGKTRDQLQQAYLVHIKKDGIPIKNPKIRNPKELTGRVAGHEVKRVLKSLEKPSISNNNPSEQLEGATDIVFATNMISVGLDISRLNLIIMNGQPKSVSEYIQVSSRIARNAPGLVISLFNPFKIRDKSHYENFASFHNNYYRFVEPTSITPYTRVAISKVMPTMFTAYLRMYHQARSPADITSSMVNDFKNYMKSRMFGYESMYKFLEKMVDALIDKLHEYQDTFESLTFNDLLVNASDKTVYDYDYDEWLIMRSMREVSPNAVLKMVTPKKSNRKRDLYDE